MRPPRQPERSAGPSRNAILAARCSSPACCRRIVRIRLCAVRLVAAADPQPGACCSTRSAAQRRRRGRTDRLGLRLWLDGRRHPLALHQPARLRRHGGAAGGAAVLLLAAAMAIYAAGDGRRGLAAALRCRCRPPLPAAGVCRPLWALFEWLRGWLFTGFPWMSAGYAPINSPLAGYAPIIGVYGLGWLAALLPAPCWCCCTGAASGPAC
jgi:hypothetical protein